MAMYLDVKKCVWSVHELVIWMEGKKGESMALKNDIYLADPWVRSEENVMERQ